MSHLEDALLLQIRAVGIATPLRELLFARPRKFRFDFAWPEKRIAAEVEGGTQYRSRHTTAAGYEKDCEKYNLAASLGWRVYRFTSKMVTDGRAITFLEGVLK